MRNSIECSRVKSGFQNLSGREIPIIVLILSSFIFSDINAQFTPKSYLKGYIVTPSEDTIRGNIEQKAVYTNVIKYKLQEKDKAIKIKLKEVKYIKIGNTVYHSVRYRKQHHIMKEVIRGAINLLSLPTPAVPNNPNQFAPLQNDPDYYLSNNGIVDHVDKEKFYQKTALYFSDFEQLGEKIGNKEYTYDDLVEIVLKYNYWHNYKRPRDK